MHSNEGCGLEEIGEAKIGWITLLVACMHTKKGLVGIWEEG